MRKDRDRRISRTTQFLLAGKQLPRDLRCDLAGLMESTDSFLYMETPRPLVGGYLRGVIYDGMNEPRVISETKVGGGPVARFIRRHT